jgi:ribosome-associated heat shock protein Hsp15
MRIDKWLWAARFYKTRALAVKACEIGRIRVQLSADAWLAAKPARELRVGDHIEIRNEGGEFTVEVRGLSEQRGPASVAQQLYVETEASQQKRALLAEQRKLQWSEEADRDGRPTKKDRRDLQKLRGRVIPFR